MNPYTTGSARERPRLRLWPVALLAALLPVSAQGDSSVRRNPYPVQAPLFQPVPFPPPDPEPVTIYPDPAAQDQSKGIYREREREQRTFDRLATEPRFDDENLEGDGE